VGSLLKIVLFTSPVLFILLYYVISQQGKIDVQMQKEDAAFEREWHEFNAEFTKDPDKKKEYADRARQAEVKRQETEKKEKEKQEKVEKLESEMDKVLQDKETQEELEKRLKKMQ
jgi:cell shape-determining protein MreC